jgi:hypothetical protein
MVSAISRTEKGFFKNWQIPEAFTPSASTVSLNPVERMTERSGRIRLEISGSGGDIKDPDRWAPLDRGKLLPWEKNALLPDCGHLS